MIGYSQILSESDLIIAHGENSILPFQSWIMEAKKKSHRTLTVPIHIIIKQ